MTTPTGTRTTENVSVNHPTWFYNVYSMTKTRAWQKAPFNLVLPYSFQEGVYNPGGPGTGVLGSPRHVANTMIKAYYDPNIATRLRNRSYEKLRGKLYDTAGLGVDFAEYRQALGMMTTRCGQLLKFTKQVKQFDFYGAARTLKMGVIPPGVSKRKAWANNWLEYWFGWKPLIGDIGDALEIIGNPLKSFSAERGRATEIQVNTVNTDFGSVRDRGWYAFIHSVTQGATVKAVNGASLHMLEQYGLNNPLSLAWEIVPFSFVVDWFVNVGDFLGSLTDYAGMTLDRTYTTELFRNSEYGQIRLNPGYSSGGQLPRDFWGSSTWMIRSQSLTGVSLTTKKLKLPSKERAATAVSLLIQQFGR